MHIGQDVSLVEMGRSDVSLCCTLGKIVLWFGSQANRETVRRVVEAISRVDSQATCEHVVVCDFKDIAQYESKGYILSSYARKGKEYRAIFSVPFSRKSAIDFFVDSIMTELKKGDVKKTLHLNGSYAKINLIFEQLKSLENWELKNVEYKQAEQMEI